MSDLWLNWVSRKISYSSREQGNKHEKNNLDIRDTQWKFWRKTPLNCFIRNCECILASKIPSLEHDINFRPSAGSWIK